MKRKNLAMKTFRKVKAPSQQYLIDAYRIAKSDAALAVTDGDRAAALRDLKRIFDLASQTYGFNFADSLNDIKP